MISTGTATAPERTTGDIFIRAITLDVQKMTPEVFAPYGQIIGARGQVELDLDGGNASFVAQTVESRPFQFSFLGRNQVGHRGRAAVRERFGGSERRANGGLSG